MKTLTILEQAHDESVEEFNTRFKEFQRIISGIVTKSGIRRRAVISVDGNNATYTNVHYVVVSHGLS